MHKIEKNQTKRDLTSLITIVVPAYNEYENIPHLIDEISKVMKGRLWEILIVNDGSSDKTVELLELLSKENSKVRYISFSRNFGHQAALKAGFDYAKGDCLISMDADMQHPPSLIPKMLQKWQDGFNAVHTIRKDPPSISFKKKFMSSLFYKVLNICTGQHIPEGSADFRLVDRSIIDECKNLNEQNFFWRALIPWLGGAQCYIEYEANERKFGESKYTFKKMFRLALDGLTSFSILPLRLASLFGALLIVCGLSYFFISLLFVRLVHGWASLIGAILIFSGVQLLTLGIMGEYIGKIHLSVKNRPIYIIERENITDEPKNIIN